MAWSYLDNEDTRVRASKISRCLGMVKGTLVWIGSVHEYRPLVLVLGVSSGSAEMKLVGRPLGETTMHDGDKQRFLIKLFGFYPGLSLPSWVIMVKLLNHSVPQSSHL